MHDHLSYAFKSGIITSPLLQSPKTCVLLCTGRGGMTKTWSIVQNLGGDSSHPLVARAWALPSPRKPCFPAGLEVNWWVFQQVPHLEWGSGSNWAPTLFLDWQYVTGPFLWCGWTLVLATVFTAQERDGNIMYYMLRAGPFCLFLLFLRNKVEIVRKILWWKKNYGIREQKYIDSRILGAYSKISGFLIGHSSSWWLLHLFSSP